MREPLYGSAMHAELRVDPLLKRELDVGDLQVVVRVKILRLRL